MESGQQPINILVFLQRRKMYILMPFISALTLFTLVTIMLPSVYTSTAGILIEGQEIPDNLVHSTVTGFVEERLRQLKQHILSRENLGSIIKDMGLYPEMVRTYSEQELVNKMRKDILVEPIQTEVVDMRTGRSATATVAFTLSYESKDPKKAQEVTEILLQLFLRENIQARESKAWQAYSFLERRLDELQTEILLTEEKIAGFKEKNLRSLPELMDLNLRNLDAIQKDVEIKQIQVQAAKDRLIFLKGQLATQEPSTAFMALGMPKPMTLEEQLKSLRSRYVSLKAVHSDKHPDVIRVKIQIRAMEQVADAKGQLAHLYGKLKDLHTRRTMAMEDYSPQHPTVLALDAQIKALHEEIDRISTMAGQTENETPDKPDNPAYIGTLTQIESAQLEIANLDSIIVGLRKKYEDYQRIIEQTPKVEQEYQAMQRHYQSIQKEHRDTFIRLQAAREAVGMEEQQMGERFTVAEPPQLPEKPSKPNRPLLFILGLMFSLGLGGLVGIVAEHLDHSVHSTVELMEVTGKPALGLVPYLQSPRERRLHRSRQRIGLIMAAAFTIGAVVMIHVLYMPLGLIWRKAIKYLDFLL